jgi:hypothetical protein
MKTLDLILSKRMGVRTTKQELKTDTVAITQMIIKIASIAEYSYHDQKKQISSSTQTANKT